MRACAIGGRRARKRAVTENGQTIGVPHWRYALRIIRAWIVPQIPAGNLASPEGSFRADRIYRQLEVEADCSASSPAKPADQRDASSTFSAPSSAGGPDGISPLLFPLKKSKSSRAWASLVSDDIPAENSSDVTTPSPFASRVSNSASSGSGWPRIDELGTANQPVAVAIHACNIKSSINASTFIRGLRGRVLAHSQCHELRHKLFGTA